MFREPKLSTYAIPLSFFLAGLERIRKGTCFFLTGSLRKVTQFYSRVVGTSRASLEVKQFNQRLLSKGEVEKQETQVVVDKLDMKVILNRPGRYYTLSGDDEI